MEFLAQFSRFIRDRSVVGISRRPKQRFDLAVGQSLDEARLAQGRLAPAFGDFTKDPLKVLERLIALGQNVNRVLDRDGANALQASPDFDAEVIRFRRNLVDQEKPAGFALFGHRSSLYTRKIQLQLLK